MEKYLPYQPFLKSKLKIVKGLWHFALLRVKALFIHNSVIWDVSSGSSGKMIRMRLDEQHYLYLSDEARSKMRFLSMESHERLQQNITKKESKLKNYIIKTLSAGILDGQGLWHEPSKNGSRYAPSKLFRPESALQSIITRAKCLLSGKKFIKDPRKRAYNTIINYKVSWNNPIVDKLHTKWKSEFLKDELYNLEEAK
jgi:hypothetical protein